MNAFTADPGWKAYVLGLWEGYLAADLAHARFVRELTKGEISVATVTCTNDQLAAQLDD